MFELPNLKSFMDIVHGYIRIPKVFVDNIIDTREFQRLRNIDQTGMKILYPSAKHDRFIHSLGVYHLGYTAVNALLQNFLENTHWNIRSDQTNSIYWAKNKVLLLIACLLHDIGHAPFSHSLEYFYGFEGDSEKRAKLLNLLKDSFDEFTDSEQTAFINSSEHEKMSAFLILQDNLWRNRIKIILRELGNSEYPKQEICSDGEYDQDMPYIDDSDIDNDLRFIARMILGVKYSNYSPEAQMKNCFVELLNGGFDVDKLDYTIRDTEMSGISNTTLDVERLLNSLTIIPTTVYENNENMDISATENRIIITNLETMEDNSIRIKGSIDREVPIMKCKIDFPAKSVASFYPMNSKKTAGVIREDGCRVYAKKETTVKVAGVEVVKGTGNIQIVACNDLTDSGSWLEIKDAEFKDPFLSSFPGETYSLIFDTGEADEPVQISTYKERTLNWTDIAFSGSIEGAVKRLEVLSDELSKKRIVPSKGCYTSFSLGFKKQAINLVANVSEARNYLYLWIYSHHKVVYYANYLIVELTRIALENLPRKRFVRKKDSEKKRKVSVAAEDVLFETIKGDSGYLLDECFIHQKLRAVAEKFEKSNDSEYKPLYDELVSRVYRTSLYKSLAEFDLRFNCFDDGQKQKMCEHLECISSVNKQKSYGTINKDVLEQMKFEGTSISEVVEDLLWVSSNPSIKRPSGSSVYIVFGSEKHRNITTLDRLPLLRFSEYNGNQRYYFYLYYKVNKNTTDETKELVFQAFLGYMKKFLKQ